MPVDQPPLLAPDLLERIQHLSLVARRVAEGALHGLHRSRLHGLSIEFAQHREYSPGDEIKHIDWQVAGRSDRYVIKQYELETNLRAMILVDASASMAYGDHAEEEAPSASASQAEARNAAVPDVRRSKFHYARTLAAALSYLLIHQGDSVGLIVSADRIWEQLPLRATPGHVLSICQSLERIRPAGKTDLPGVMGQLAARFKRRGLLIVISDLLDDPQRLLLALGQLHHRGHEVVVFQVLDPRELDFRLATPGRNPTVIRDMETGEEFDAEPNLIRDLVRGEIQRFLEQLDAGARNIGLHLVRCSTAEPAEQVLTRYLHRRLKGARSRL
jgi:uncharacterized protein (DUF58 family)